MQCFYGLRLSQLGTPALSWRRLEVLLTQLPAHCALHRSERGLEAAWGLSEHLLASIVDALNAANWQRGGDPKAKRPKPVERPGIEPEGVQIGSDVRPLPDVQALFERRRMMQAAAAEREGVTDGD